MAPDHVCLFPVIGGLSEHTSTVNTPATWHNGAVEPETPQLNPIHTQHGTAMLMKPATLIGRQPAAMLGH